MPSIDYPLLVVQEIGARPKAYCETCASPLLGSKAQSLLATRDAILEDIARWIDTLGLAYRQQLLNEIPTEAGKQSAVWLKATFPDIYLACFGDALCGLQPDYFRKMQRRFLTQARRRIAREGWQAGPEVLRWLVDRCASHPFASRIDTFRNQVTTLARQMQGPWELVRGVDPWRLLNLNPHIASDSTVFTAEGEPGAVLYFVDQVMPMELVTACGIALRFPIDHQAQFIAQMGLEPLLREELGERVERLRWPC